MAKLLYQGHGSFRIEGSEGTIIYVDPYMGEGYTKDADYIIITHEHHDHNKIEIVPKKKDCVILRAKDFIQDTGYKTFEFKDVVFEGVQAYNKNHKVGECIGCIITIDTIKIYAAGDTSTTKDIETMSSRAIDYALLPCDGIYNMDVEEASLCANLIQAKHSIPIHTKPETLYDQKIAEQFHGINALLVTPAKEITL